MSNKSRRPGQRSSNPGEAVKRFSEGVAKAAELMQERKAMQEQMADPEEFPQAQGQLPLPVKQVVNEHSYQWVWEPILDTIKIEVTFMILDDQWAVVINDDNEDEFLHPDDAKKVGEALLAAWNWQFIWKEHFADYMLKAAREPKKLSAEPQKRVPRAAKVNEEIKAKPPEGPVEAKGVTQLEAHDNGA